jgi:hypothetical protein
MDLRSTSLAFVVSRLCVATPGHAHDDPAPRPPGRVSFESSCTPNAQTQLERGASLLHSFLFSAAEATFRDVLLRDSSCAIATWGIAAALMSNPMSGHGLSASEADRAQAAIAQGRTIVAKTQRERDYIEAVAAYYAEYPTRNERDREAARAQAFQALAARYPEDDEAQIFAALYTAATQQQSDRKYSTYLKAASVLEKQLAKHPDHPGVAHYLILCYDAPPLARQGLGAARRYVDLAPYSPHALHIPSHILTRAGEWESSAATNHLSVEFAVKASDADGAYHASDHLVYANLQMARDSEVRKEMEIVSKIATDPARPTASYAKAAMAARYAVERGAWRDAMQLPAPAITSKFPYVDSVTHFARALGAAREGDVAAAEKDAAQISGLHAALVEAKDSWWATEVEVQKLAANAWIALARKNSAAALDLMRTAADLEDRNEKQHSVMPGRILPARELLGDMLLELKQPGAALMEYEASQMREPNRFRGLYGIARAAEAAGDRAKAEQAYERLLAMTKNGDGMRQELATAKSFTASPGNSR